VVAGPFRTAFYVVGIGKSRRGAENGRREVDFGGTKIPFSEGDTSWSKLVYYQTYLSNDH